MEQVHNADLTDCDRKKDFEQDSGEHTIYCTRDKNAGPRAYLTISGRAQKTRRISDNAQAERTRFKCKIVLAWRNALGKCSHRLVVDVADIRT